MVLRSVQLPAKENLLWFPWPFAILSRLDRKNLQNKLTTLSCQNYRLGTVLVEGTIGHLPTKMLVSVGLPSH